ncbi:MAG TPA: hypothetical protein VG148_10285 [Pyrinomonadaceae bacterium]|nr:hypothetical protein [Pyrinomonadaceae bacterium]
MDNTDARAGILLRWSPLFFAGATAALLISASEGPLSGGYLLRAVVVGVIYSSLTISFRRWELTHLDRLIRSLLIAALIAGGFFWSRDQTFGDVHVRGPLLALAGQFLSAVLAVFFAVLSVLGLKSRGAR